MRKTPRTSSRKCPLWRHSISLVIVIILFFALALAVRAQNDNKNSQPPDTTEVMAAVPYSVGEKERWLILVKIVIPWDRKERAYYGLMNPDNPPFNIAFVIADSPTKEITNGKVIAITYDFFMEGSMPPPVWHGQLLWRAESREAFVVILRTTGRREIRVFRFDLAQELGKYPLRLEPKNRSEWPQPVPLLSEIEQEARGTRSVDLISPFEKLELSIEKDLLQIRGLRKGKEHPPLLLDFDIRTKKWREPSNP
jgi:hypothetical protein